MTDPICLATTTATARIIIRETWPSCNIKAELTPAPHTMTPAIAWHLRILGAKPGDSPDDIKKAYWQLARRFHPDVNPDPAARNLFKKAANAYDALTTFFSAETVAVLAPAHGTPHIHWPLLVIDKCPFNNEHGHLHTMLTPGPWSRRAPCCREPYIIRL